MLAFLTNRSVQVFLFALAALGAICALLAVGVIDKAYGQSAIGLIIGFGLGVPVVATDPAPIPPVVPYVVPPSPANLPPGA